MKRLQFLIVLVAVLLFGCNVRVGPRLTGAGVTFVVPLQTSQADHGSFGINYKSESFNASTDGRNLLVSGRRYGVLKVGDVVDFTEPGVVKVNDAVRTADGT